MCVCVCVRERERERERIRGWEGYNLHSNDSDFVKVITGFLIQSYSIPQAKVWEEPLKPALKSSLAVGILELEKRNIFTINGLVFSQVLVNFTWVFQFLSKQEKEVVFFRYVGWLDGWVVTIEERRGKAKHCKHCENFFFNFALRQTDIGNT